MELESYKSSLDFLYRRSLFFTVQRKFIPSWHWNKSIMLYVEQKSLLSFGRRCKTRRNFLRSIAVLMFFPRKKYFFLFFFCSLRTFLFPLWAPGSDCGKNNFLLPFFLLFAPPPSTACPPPQTVEWRRPWKSFIAQASKKSTWRMLHMIYVASTCKKIYSESVRSFALIYFFSADKKNAGKHCM